MPSPRGLSLSADSAYQPSQSSSNPTLASSTSDVPHLAPSKSVHDLTSSNRGTDPRDAGGFVGPQADKCKIYGGIDMDPLLLNCSLQMHPCSSKDLLLVCSDGIHDNFDPEFLGKSPMSLGGSAEKWNEIPRIESVRLRTSFRVSALEKLVASATAPKDIAESLKNYVTELTAAGRLFMEKNGGDEPHDKKVRLSMNDLRKPRPRLSFLCPRNSLVSSITLALLWSTSRNRNIKLAK
jgi:hypothetical protein